MTAANDEQFRSISKNSPKPALGTVSDINTPPPGPLDRAKPLSVLYGLTQLKADRNRRLVSIANLPSWPNQHENHTHGHGWGGPLNKLLGGGLLPGYLLAVGAWNAGGGKTALVMQLADGLALRTYKIIKGQNAVQQELGAKPPPKEPLTPVLILSEMPAEALAWRTLGRWTGCDNNIFRAGDSAAEIHGEETVNNALKAGEEALGGDLGKSRDYICYYDNVNCLAGKPLVDDVAAAIEAWRKQLQIAHPERDIWPVLVMDPIQRWQQSGVNETEALNELVEALQVTTRREKFITIATSDTNKASATSSSETKGKNAPSEQEQATAVFRGSYKLMHLPDAAITVRTVGNDGENRTVEIPLAKNRWGNTFSDPKISYTWHTPTGRFTAKRGTKRTTVNV